MSDEIVTASGLPTGFIAFQQQYALETKEAIGGTWRYRQTTPGKPAMLCLPGAAGTGDIFYRTAAAFAGRYNVITLTYPATDDNAAMADGIAALIDALRVAPAIVVSSSLGGYVAQVLAARHPAKLRLVVLGNTFRDPTSQQSRWPPPDEFAKVTPESFVADARKKLAEGPTATSQAAELKAILLSLVGTDQSPVAAKAQRLAVLRANIQRKLDINLERIALIDDDEDTVIARSTREDIRKVYAGCQHQRIPKGGHYPSILAPETYARALETIFAVAGC